jgi:glucuronyl/N-acetylglucosaminyl transferase EXT2
MRSLNLVNNQLLTNPYQQKYSIVTMTYKRLDLIKPFVEHHIQCPHVDAIHIVWNDMDDKPPNEEDFFDIDPAYKDRTVKFQVYDENNLNNRFIPPKGLATEAVFNVDDDMLIPCEFMSAAFESWMAAPDSLVGFAPRLHTFDVNTAQWKYHKRGWVWFAGRHSLMLTKACFMHRKYMWMYTYVLAQEMKDYVFKGRNCEDVLMNFMVANATHAPPVWVHAHMTDIGSKVVGISSKQAHYDRRTDCIEKFVEFFGRDPLVYSQLKVVVAQHNGFWQWLWGFWSSV